METNKKLLWIDALILLLPSVYLAVIYNSLPETVPMHYDMHGEPNDFGHKSELIFINVLLLFVGMGTNLLIIYLNKIDPKKTGHNEKLLGKITVVVSILLCVIQLYILFSTQKQSFSSPKPVLVLVSLMFTFLGNLMYNVKPNYFVGIRTPWTLENEEVWRRTHHLGAKLWFWAGLVLAFLVLVLPLEAGTFVLPAIALLITIVPIAYSYRVFKELKGK